MANLNNLTVTINIDPSDFEKLKDYISEVVTKELQKVYIAETKSTKCISDRAIPIDYRPISVGYGFTTPVTEVTQSVIQTESGLSDLFNQIDADVDKFKDGLTALSAAIDDVSGTDPMGLMWVFSIKEWRYKLSDWLMMLSIWLDGEDSY